MTASAPRLRQLALLSPVSVVIAIGLALPVEVGAAAGGKGDRLPLACAGCGENVRVSERVEDAAAGITTLIRLPAMTDVAFGSAS